MAPGCEVMQHRYEICNQYNSLGGFQIWYFSITINEVMIVIRKTQCLLDGLKLETISQRPKGKTQTCSATYDFGRHQQLTTVLLAPCLQVAAELLSMIQIYFVISGLQQIQIKSFKTANQHMDCQCRMRLWSPPLCRLLNNQLPQLRLYLEKSPDEDIQGLQQSQCHRIFTQLCAEFPQVHINLCVYIYILIYVHVYVL